YRLAAVLLTQGRAKDAESYFRDALRQQRAYAAPQKMALAAILDDYAVNQIELGHLDEANSLAPEALTVREAILPPIHPTIARTLSTLSTVAWRRGQFTEALQLIRRSTKITLALDKPDQGASYRYQLHVRAVWWEAFGHGKAPSKELL